ncbi:MAG: FG-GAP-like repeat-containing protein, partial [bacterium]
CTSFCQTGWYSSPAVADLDNDGQPEVIYGSYDLVVLNGMTGALRARAPNGSRVWPGVAIADLNNDGTKEIIVGRGSNQVTVYHFVPPSTLSVVWTRNPFVNHCSGNGCEVRTLAVEDLESDGQLEVIVGRASGGDDEQIQVFDANGNVRAGFPARHVGEQGFGWGMYNENITVGDLDNDGFKEIYGPTDTHYITAVDRNGNGLPTNPMFNDIETDPPIPHPWARVGVHVDLAADVEGFAECGVQHRPNFANSAPAIADVNGDGIKELIVIGDVYNCDIGDPDGDLYHLPWILKMDRSRWTGSGFDWTVIPTAEPNSGPKSQDFDVIQNDVQNAVVADLDNDGFKEILYPSYDGRLHAYWLDKTEHGSWPYAVPGAGIHFASEPIVADIDADGQAEVIFTSWPQEGSGQVGQLHILSSQGVPLQTISLPPSFPAGDINGGLAAPTIANIDADADLEIVVGTMSSGAVAYDLAGSASARVLWGTGRGGYRRTGAVTDVSDLAITKTDGQTTAVPGSPISYTIVASNTSGGAVTGAVVADTFPAAVTGVTWICGASAGSSCVVGSGAGNINRTVNLLAGGTVTFTATG